MVGLLSFPGTEAQDKEPVFPAGWSGLFGLRDGLEEEYEIFVDRQVKHTGKASCCVKSEVRDPQGGGVLLQNFKADDYLGKRLRLTAFVKSQEVNSDEAAGLFLVVNGATQGNLAADYMLTRRIRGTTEWKSYALVVDVPMNAVVIGFGISMKGPGQVWVDDFKFEIVEKDVKTTGGEIQPNDSKGAIRKDIPKKPKNLGFEE